MKRKLSQFGNSIRHQVSNRKFIRLFLSLTLIILLPLFIVIVNKSQDIRQRAAEAQHVQFINDTKAPITQTTTPMVHVSLASPWGVSQSTAMSENENQVLGQQTATFQVLDSYGDVNQLNNAFDSSYGPTSKQLWIGSGGSTSSYTGFRFTNVTIPKNAVISSAMLQVYSTQEPWISMRFQISADASGNSQAFSSNSLPSSRQLTAARVTHSSNTKWKARTWYSLNQMSSVIQEIVNRPDWQSGNSISIILKGIGGGFGRKFIGSFDGAASVAPQLVVSFDSGTTTFPTQTITAAPTSIPPVVLTTIPTPTTVPVTRDIILAEDSAFTKNVVTLSPITTNPTYAMYTFSNATPGTKTLYAKFRSSTGGEQISSNTIQLVSTPTPTAISNMPEMGGNSHAMGLWKPNMKYDTCLSYPAGITTDQQKSDYIKSLHDAYKVKGPDGKWYPTWHPPVDPTTGCKFGHEHGRDPHGSDLFSFAQEVYGYDANNNGTLDPDERALSGIPMGYVNEQLDIFNASKGITNGMRHEDHVGHKFEWEDNVERDWSDVIGGGTAGARTPSGIVCDMMMKVHQGTHSKDAFTNNMHELLQFAECSDGLKMGNAIMVNFGRPGGFQPSDKSAFISVGSAAPSNSQPGSGTRFIPTLGTVKQTVLVPQGQWSHYSEGIYEDWVSGNYIYTPSGTRIAYFDPHFAVFSPSRFYWSASDTSVTGVTRTAQDLADNVGRSVDLCYMTEKGNEIARGGECMFQTNYGQNMTPIAWDDPRSQFNGVHREFYFNNFTAENVGSNRIWYSEPFGKNAVTSSFVGGVKQYLKPKNDPTPYTKPFESDALGANRSYGGNGVHAPN